MASCVIQPASTCAAIFTPIRFEGYFLILKRGITGTYHHVSQKHLNRYLAEFDFRYNNPSKLGIEDGERAMRALMGIEGSVSLTGRLTKLDFGAEAKWFLRW